MIHTIMFHVKFSDFMINKLSDTYGGDIYNVNRISQLKVNGVNYYSENYDETKGINININAIEYLGKADIVESDLDEMEELITRLEEYLSCHDGYRLVLSRIDYRIDACVKDEKIRKYIIELFSKGPGSYARRKKVLGDNKVIMYETTVYYRNKSIEIKIYDKEAERKAKGIAFEVYEQDVIRLEISLHSKHLAYKQSKKGVKRDLKSYFSYTKMCEYIKKMIPGHIGMGDFYTLKAAGEKIQNDRELKDQYKSKLKTFLSRIAKNRIDEVKTHKNRGTNRKYIRQLEMLGINYITINSADSKKLGVKYIMNPFKEIIKSLLERYSEK